jgi:hypothetical protein
MSERGTLYRVAIRRDLAAVKPAAAVLDGHTFRFTPGWVMSEEDTSIYVGETAMLFADWTAVANEYGDETPAWIASGDLVIAEGAPNDR